MRITRAIVVQRRKNYERTNLKELKSLAEAAGYQVVGSVEQRRKPDPRYQIGRGKAHQLAEMADDLKVDRIIFENDLKPVQSYNLAQISNVEIIDRFQLILEIFTKRASTKEAHLQIRLANLQRQLPRAREMVRLARMGERPGFLGLGRYEVDIYYDEIKKRINNIKKELNTIRRHRSLHRTRRTEFGFPLVSLAGYTDAGKTTLFNYLTGESQRVDSTLFTTLTTTTRSIKLEGGRALLTDTVGFIDRLPLALVEAFHSTLEETIHADVIILLVDFHESFNEVKRKILCSLDIIDEIGAGGIPIITALNKLDLLPQRELEHHLSLVTDFAPNPTPISALQGINIDGLVRTLSHQLGKIFTVEFRLPLTQDALSFLSALHTRVTKVKRAYNDEEIKVIIKSFPWLLEEIIGEVKKLNGAIDSYSQTEPMT